MSGGVKFFIRMKNAVALKVTTENQYHRRKGQLMLTDIKPGPKPKRDDGKDDRRHHVNPETKPKHPTLPVHKPTK
jgi:hypothetical protein